MRHADFVTRLGAGRPPRAFGKDDELAIAGKLDASAFDHGGERLRAGTAVDRHHAALDHEPAEDWDPLQFAFDDEQWIVEQLQQREGFPRRLMLGGDDERALRNFFAAPDLAIDGGDDA